MKLFTITELLLAVAVPTQAAFTWQNVKIGGGGGFVPSFVFHPNTKGVAYARTDIGGIYRLNSDDSWTAVTDSLADNANWGKWGVDALALDPQDDTKVYAAVGAYTNNWDPNNGAIIRSSDQGATWLSTTLPFKVGGNMPGRGMGERLAVDPANSKIIYFGARSGNGLWKSTDAGVTFTKVSSFTAKGSFVPNPTDTTGYNSDPQGVAFVTFDSTSGTTSGATSRIFVGTADNTTSSVWVTEDSGRTWTAAAGQPGTYFPHKAVLQPTQKVLYLTYSDGTGPYDGTLGAVYRYNITAGTWTNITPVSGSDIYFGFGGMGVDMQSPGTIVVASLNSWWPDAQIFRSTDSGATWSKLWEWASYPDMNLYYSQSATKAPWIKAGFLDVDTKDLGWMIESLVIDPLDSDHWLYSTGLTVFGGHDLTNWDSTHNITIQVLADGIEEFSVQDLASAPGGSELLVGVGDDSGFTFASSSVLKTSPQKPWNDPMFSGSVGVDYAGANVKSVVRVGGTAGTQQMALSNDGGASWYAYAGADTSMSGGSVAYSADADTILWSTSANGVQRSQHSSSFSRVSSLPASTIIAADKQKNAYFYAGSAATFYVSKDTGTTFAAGGTLTGATSVRDIAAHPKIAGEVWVSTNVGIFRSTDYGATFTKVPTALTNTYQIALGLGSGSTWNVYAFGTGSAGARLYASGDTGATWTDIQGATQGFGAIDSCKLAGSGNTADQVFVGTNGRGVFYASGSLSGGSGGSTTTTRSSTTLSTTTKASTATTKSTTTTKTPTTTTTSKTNTSSTATPTGTVLHYGQCGGLGYSGPKTCVSPYTCTAQNDYYFQCL
ncbi:glycoside hydrolase family 74 protein [Xylaria bambusicola]|uniref:glycoside hydrolase family 74 protein n=1 Tax=Xylaria bambusicola TaxID=326684 RepID=UPI0020071F6D|nr:glycoside hydrolase family 74 protein [Xylaria bambusicola]KAI0517950.1 glycoside hydrolase family 74 protein [Xylaria bambusicola]